MKSLILTAAGFALVGGAAYAAGPTPVPQEPMVMTPAPAPVVSETWTGAYGGVSLGYGSADTEGSDLLEGDFGSEDDDDDDLFDYENDGDGIIGGAFAGYNYDFGRFVVGGEADLNAANLDFDDDDLFDNDPDNDGGASIDQIHRLKLRAGYDAGNALVYGVAGAAYAKAEIFENDFEDTGYVVGAGVDYKVTQNVTVGGEVLYHDFEEFDDSEIELDATTIQARVGYQF